MKISSMDCGEDPKPITLEQWSRALAAHVLLTVYPHELKDFFAPEKAEEVAQFILKFARGEAVDRPEPPPADDAA